MTNLDAGHFLDAQEQKKDKLIKELVEALKEISEGKGAYDTDRLKHASNCIEEMKSIALKAIEKATK